MKIVRKVIRIFFIISLVFVCLFSAYALYEEFSRFGNTVFERLNNNPSLFILIFAILLSILSLFFNLEKIADSGKKTNIYKMTRIGDILFCLYFFCLGVVAAYTIYKRIVRESDLETQVKYPILPILITSFLFLISISLFIDNMIFHKSFKKLPKEESIEDIGK